MLNPLCSPRKRRLIQTLWAGVVCLQMPEHFSMLFSMLARGLHTLQDPKITLSPASTVHHSLEKAGACSVLPPLEGRVRWQKHIVTSSRRNHCPCCLLRNPSHRLWAKQESTMLEDYFTSPFPVRSFWYLKIHRKLHLIRNSLRSHSSMFHGAGSRTSHSVTTVQGRDTHDLILHGFPTTKWSVPQLGMLTFH